MWSCVVIPTQEPVQSLWWRRRERSHCLQVSNTDTAAMLPASVSLIHAVWPQTFHRWASACLKTIQPWSHGSSSEDAVRPQHHCQLPGQGRRSPAYKLVLSAAKWLAINTVCQYSSPVRLYKSVQLESQQTVVYSAVSSTKKKWGGGGRNFHCLYYGLWYIDHQGPLIK